MKNKDKKKMLRKYLNEWMDKLVMNEGEGFYIYPTKDRFLIVVHLEDGSYREDQEKSLKEVMGG